MEASVSEIHTYPLRPDGYAEPLFHSLESRKEILEHFAQSGWLWRASEAERPAPATVGEVQGPAPFARVLASWREVDRWWEPGGGVDLVWRLIQMRTGAQHAVATPVSPA